MSNTRRYTTLNSREILKEYPQTFHNIVMWMKSVAEGASDEEVKQIVDFTLQYNPRMLYDFFDDNNIKISMLPLLDNTGAVSYGINDKGLVFAENRNEAEEKAFIEAFKTLENDDTKRSTN